MTYLHFNKQLISFFIYCHKPCFNLWQLYATCHWQIAERSAQLHEALLHCGRFQDALESLLSWLTDTEELVANQKPPSAEFKVVKAQIQEQKVSPCHTRLFTNTPATLFSPQHLNAKTYNQHLLYHSSHLIDIHCGLWVCHTKLCA